MNKTTIVGQSEKKQLILSLVSRNFYRVQIAKVGVMLLLAAASLYFALNAVLALVTIALLLELVTLTIAHHNYTCSVMDTSRFYVQTLIADLFTTAVTVGAGMMLVWGVLP